MFDTDFVFLDCITGTVGLRDERALSSHDEDQVDQLAEVYRKSGGRCVPPVILWQVSLATVVIIDGAARVAAARQAGLDRIQAHVVAGLNEDHARRLRLVYNCRRRQQSGWRQLLADSELAKGYAQAN